MLQELKKIKVYVIASLLGFFTYVGAEMRGYRLWGDDNETKEQALTNGNSNRIYHK